MRTRPALALTALLVAALLLALQGPAGAGKLPEHGYVTSTVVLPVSNTQAADFGRDMGGSASTDNQLGKVFATFAAQGFDLSSSTNEALTAGQVVMLHSLRSGSLKKAEVATWQVRYGEPVDDPDLDGGGTFTVDPLASRSGRLAAAISRHQVSTKAGTIPVMLSLLPQMPPFELDLVKGKVFATCGAPGCADGRINGAVTEQQVNQTMIPAMTAFFAPLIVRDCPGTDANSCMDGSLGETILNLFDTDKDMTVTDAEVRQNSLVKSLLVPDLDLFDKHGEPGHDGKADSLSFGFGFTAVPATINH